MRSSELRGCLLADSIVLPRGRRDNGFLPKRTTNRRPILLLIFGEIADRYQSLNPSLIELYVKLHTMRVINYHSLIALAQSDGYNYRSGCVNSIYRGNDMSKKLELLPNAITSGKLVNAGYMTQMLLELVAQAKSRDVELAYFLEMAAICSYDLDERELRQERENAAVSA